MLWYDSKLQPIRYPKKLVTKLQMCNYSINKFYCTPRKQHPDQFHSFRDAVKHALLPVHDFLDLNCSILPGDFRKQFHYIQTINCKSVHILHIPRIKDKLQHCLRLSCLCKNKRQPATTKSQHKTKKPKRIKCLS